MAIDTDNKKLSLIFQNQPFQASVPFPTGAVVLSDLQWETGTEWESGTEWARDVIATPISGYADKWFLIWQYGVDAIAGQHVFMYYFRRRRS